MRAHTATELADSGATGMQMCSFMSWKNPKTAMEYIRNGKANLIGISEMIHKEKVTNSTTPTTAIQETENIQTGDRRTETRQTETRHTETPQNTTSENHATASGTHLTNDVLSAMKNVKPGANVYINCTFNNNSK